jgi:hypothetical protein
MKQSTIHQIILKKKFTQRLFGLFPRIFDLRGFLPLTYTHIPLGYIKWLKTHEKHLKTAF